MRPRNERSVPRNKTFKGRIFTHIRVRVNKGPRSATESFTSQDLGFVRINRDDMHMIVHPRFSTDQSQNQLERVYLLDIRPLTH
jgi:hypothetical protein